MHILKPFHLSEMAFFKTCIHLVLKKVLMKKIVFTTLIFFLMQENYAQQTIPLYEGDVPNSKPYSTKEFSEPQSNGDTLVHYISQPTLTIFLPEKSMANGTAVIICPGGGYFINSIVKEGYDVARKFNEWGVAAFVLKYRIPNDSAMNDKSIAPLQDAQRAIQFVRRNAAKYHLNGKKDWHHGILCRRAFGINSSHTF